MICLGVYPGTSVVVAASGTSATGVLAMPSGANAVHVANKSATLSMSVRVGDGAQTAVLATDLCIPPMGQVLIGAGPATTGVGVIASGAGPTDVVFTPVRVEA